ncbi:capsular polysaccharide transport system permease protein [Gemmobacter aquatilis]|uniref:Transport permease protein n=1 Tax=Gemmobacter aquatilis TaxID=933059 RepID=A0A1H8N205_9RHOB|nr:ABC transporter permease [Gemmobacter aquatilis]SEO23637.1 capsular polysaccharide transport system permease protein [Gemmobacter aquatilis]
MVNPPMTQADNTQPFATPVLPDAAPVFRAVRRFATLRTIIALMLREMSSSFGRTPGGYVWAVVEPLGAIIILAVMFSVIARHPPLGTNFLLFYATGFLPFSLYQDVSTSVTRCLSYSRPLLGYPAVTWMDALLARFILNTLTTLMVSYILLTGIIMLFETGSVIRIGPILASMTMSALIGLGVGAINCALIGLFQTWGQIWSIASKPLFIVSGVFMLIDDMPPTVRELMLYNPLIHATGEMRHGFYPMYTADYVSYTYVFTVALGMIAFGFILLGRYYREILSGE